MTQPTSPTSIFRGHAMRLYLLGHALVLLGAWLMDATASMLPMALAASAALMLSMPLFRQLASRLFARKPDAHPR
jgi:uncharacterized membrane protein